MKRCSRCKCWKPDACYIEERFDNGYMPGRCTHCRSILRELKNSVGRGGQITATALPRVIERIEPTLEARALAEYGVVERRAWEARGARKISRPYLHDSRGALVGRRTRKKAYDGGFTSSTLGR